MLHSETTECLMDADFAVLFNIIICFVQLIPNVKPNHLMETIE